MLCWGSAYLIPAYNESDRAVLMLTLNNNFRQGVPYLWCDGVWYDVVWCGVVWCGVVWCGMMCTFRKLLVSCLENRSVERPGVKDYIPCYPADLTTGTCGLDMERYRTFLEKIPASFPGEFRNPSWSDIVRCGEVVVRWGEGKGVDR